MMFPSVSSINETPIDDTIDRYFDCRGLFMLKVVQNTASTTTFVDQPTHFQGWALVRTSPKNPWQTLAVPFTVGSHADNDIFVNAPTMRALSKVIASHNGQLISIDAGTHDIVNLQDLKKFGIECVGPFQENPESISPLKRNALSLLNKESHLYASKYPAFVRKFLPRAQKTRLALLSAAGSALLATTMYSAMQEPERIDLSRHPIALTTGNIARLNIGSAQITDPYAQGATFQIQGLKEVELGQSYVLTAGLSGLDMADELQFSINGHLIYQSPAKQACLDNICSIDIPVETQLLMGEGSNVQLVVKHTHPQSSYAIKSLFLRKMEQASDEEKELAKQLMASADRYYEERQLLTKNIKNAKDAIEELERILGTRTGLDEIKPRFAVSKGKIDQFFNDTSKDLQFKMQKALKLNQFRSAIGIVQEMLKLYPDPATKQNMMLVAQLKQLEAQVNK
jgi:hypothetical protein